MSSTSINTCLLSFAPIFTCPLVGTILAKFSLILSIWGLLLSTLPMIVRLQVSARMSCSSFVNTTIGLPLIISRLLGLSLILTFLWFEPSVSASAYEERSVDLGPCSVMGFLSVVVLAVKGGKLVVSGGSGCMHRGEIWRDSVWSLVETSRYRCESYVCNLKVEEREEKEERKVYIRKV